MRAIFTRGFLLVTGATFVYASANGLIASTVALLIVQRLGLSSELIGFTIAVSAIAAVLARAPLGPAIDRYGARRFGVAGPLFIAAGAGLFWISQPGQPAIPLGIGLPLLVPVAAALWGFGISVFSTAATTYLANTIPVQRRAEGMGYYGVGMTVGQGIGAGFGYSIVASAGFEALYAIAATAAILACLMLTQLNEVPSSASVTRQRIGFEPKVLAPTLGLLTLTSANGFTLALVPLMGAQRGIPNPAIFFLASAIASIVGRLGGRIADRSRLRAIVPGMLVVSVAQLVLVQAGSMEFVVVAGLTAGLGVSIAQPALQALAIDLAPQGRRGAAVATFTAALDVGVLVGTTAAGIIFAHASFGGAFLAGAMSPVIGLLLLLTLVRRATPRVALGRQN